jgi:hypothetical protein
MGAGRESLIGQTAVQGPVVRSRVSTARPRGMNGLPSSGCTGAGPTAEGHRARTRQDIGGGDGGAAVGPRQRRKLRPCRRPGTAKEWRAAEMAS